MQRLFGMWTFQKSEILFKVPDLCKRPNSFQIETDLDDVPVEATKLIACLTGHQF